MHPRRSAVSASHSEQCHGSGQLVSAPAHPTPGWHSPRGARTQGCSSVSLWSIRGWPAPHTCQGWVAGRTGNTLHEFKSKSHNWALTGWCRINSRCVRLEGQQLSSAWEDGIVRVGPDLACAGRGSWGYLGPSGWTGGSSSGPGGHGPVGGSVRSGARCLPSHPLLVDLAQDPPSCPPLSALSLLRTTPPSAPPGSPWNSPPHTLRETSKDA